MRAWTDEDIIELRKAVRLQGGDVKLPVRLTRDGGIEAQIVVPADKPQGWAARLLAEFDAKRRAG